jgi:hypothetical protein
MKGESNDRSFQLRLQISMASFSLSGVAGFWRRVMVVIWRISAIVLAMGEWRQEKRGWRWKMVKRERERERERRVSEGKLYQSDR